MLWLAQAFLAVGLVEAQSTPVSLPTSLSLTPYTTTLFLRGSYLEAAWMTQDFMHFLFALFPFLRVIQFSFLLLFIRRADQ